MIPAISPAFLGCHDPIYHTAEELAATGVFRGYYSMDIQADTAGAPTKSLFEQNGLLPVSFRMIPDLDAEPVRFERDFTKAPELVHKAAEAGYRSATTWIMPGSHTLEAEQYRAQIVERLQRMCELLGRFDLVLAVEMVAPKTLQRTFRYPISCTTRELLKLIARVGRKNIGVCLDTFHAYCLGDVQGEYAAITEPQQLAIVHINDAVAGVPPELQLDQDRRLPGETGLIDCGQLFRKLRELRYDGAVVLEPIDKRLAEMPFAQALHLAAESVKRIWPEGCI